MTNTEGSQRAGGQAGMRAGGQVGRTMPMPVQGNATSSCSAPAGPHRPGCAAWRVRARSWPAQWAS